MRAGGTRVDSARTGALRTAEEIEAIFPKFGGLGA